MSYKSYTLNDCPFCQASSAHGQYVIMYSDMCGKDNLNGLASYVYCRKCKAHGPLIADGVHQRAEAADLWNCFTPQKRIKGLFSK